MPTIGFHCSHEQIPPGDLLAAVRHAEQAGFAAAMSSDHFSPWSERQGESGFAWSFLGAALEATSLPFGVVNAPGQRYHPAIVAQAAASLCQMFPGRLWVALGSGEASNEHITGERWPSKAERNARLRECVDVIRALFAGEVVDHHGRVVVDRARLWTLPPEPPPLIGPAVSVETAAWVAEWADGLVTVNQPPDKLERMIAAFRENGGDGKRIAVQVHLSWAPDEDSALEIAYDQWRTNVFAPPLCWDLHTVEQFDIAAEHVSPQTVRDTVLVSADPGRHVEVLRELAALGFDEIYLHHVGREQERFIDAFGEHVLPESRGLSMRLDHTSDLWWKNAVVYCVDVETFLDSDGDGVGDFEGLIRQIDYLAGLGVTCLWLMPFYPSPNRDDGYDVTDYYGVDPRLGNLGQFVELVRTANDRGIKVIVDLVVNHTSDEHPWFKAARADPASPFRSYYVWRDEPSEQPAGIAFPDKETSNWQHDPDSGQYYLHRFYRFQPDLNVANPAVRDEIARIAGFWLQLGVAGFRMDAVPFLLETEGIQEGVEDDPHGFLRRLRSFATRRRGETLLLGEVNTDLKALARFFGDEDGDQLNAQFAFLLNQNLWLSLAREDAEPLEAVIRTLPTAPPDNAWATFLRNHDELSLDKLTESQRKEVFAAFGPRKEMQLYGHGLRRRTATMLGGDGPRLRMAWSLMLSLPGTPVIFMGDEIGMGENLAIPDRLSVRVPMQWSDERAGGFSSAPPKELVRPMRSGRFGPKHVNVAAQRRDDDSLLNFLERLIRRRKETPEFGWGSSTLIETEAGQLFAHHCDWQGSTVAAVHNLSSRKARATLDLGVATGERVAIDDLLETREHRPNRDGTLDVELAGYGYLWLRVRRAGERPLS